MVRPKVKGWELTHFSMWFTYWTRCRWYFYDYDLNLTVRPKVEGLNFKWRRSLQKMEKESIRLSTHANTLPKKRGRMSAGGGRDFWNTPYSALLPTKAPPQKT